MNPSLFTCFPSTVCTQVADTGALVDGRIYPDENTYQSATATVTYTIPQRTRTSEIINEQLEVNEDFVNFSVNKFHDCHTSLLMRRLSLRTVYGLHIMEFNIELYLMSNF